MGQFQWYRSCIPVLCTQLRLLIGFERFGRCRNHSRGIFNRLCELLRGYGGTLIAIRELGRCFQCVQSVDIGYTWVRSGPGSVLSGI